MFTVPRRAVTIPLASLVAMATVLYPGRASAAQTSDPFPYIATVTADHVYVRCGAAPSYYPFGALETGTLVQVVGEKSNWTRINTVGPWFADFFGYIKHASTDTGRFRLSADGKTGWTLVQTDVVAPNLNTSFDAKDSWKPIVRLRPQHQVSVIETFSTATETVHKIRLPKTAIGWIDIAYLRRASLDEVAAWEAAIAPTAPVEPAGPKAPSGEATPDLDQILGRPADVPMVVDRAVTELTGETATPAVPAAEAPGAVPLGKPAWQRRAEALAEARLDELEIAFAHLVGEPPDTANVQPLRRRYIQLAEETTDVPAVSRYAAARAEQLDVWSKIQKRRTELAALLARARRGTGDAQASRAAFEASGEYAAAGQLSASIVYDGKRLPKLLRVFDPETGRTVVYLQPDSYPEMDGMLGPVVGLRGEKLYDKQLRLTLITPRRIEILEAER
jgi:hypothetical protein